MHATPRFAVDSVTLYRASSNCCVALGASAQAVRDTLLLPVSGDRNLEILHGTEIDDAVETCARRGLRVTIIDHDDREAA